MSNRELVYRISVRGQAEAISAIRSVSQAARDQAREEARVTAGVEATRVQARRAGSRDVRRVVDDEAAHQKKVGELNRTFEIRMARERVREMERAAKEKERSATSAAKSVEKALSAEVKAHEKAEAAKTKATEREAKMRAKAEKAEASELQRWVEQAQERGMREQVRRQNADQRSRERDARQYARDRAFEDRRLYKGAAVGLVEGVGSAARYTYGLAARGVREVANGMGVSRGYDVGDIIQERAAISRGMRSVAIEARTAGGSFGDANFNEGAAKSRLADVARTSGYSQTELMSAIDAASEKGSGASALASLDKIATQARAMGADPADIAKMRANLGSHGMNDTAIDSFMARMHFVGKTGVFRAKDMVAQSEQMLASFGPDIASGGDRFLGFANEARRSTGSGAMARTAFDSALDALTKKRGKIEAMGVNYEDEHGNARNPVDIITSVIAATGGDRTKLSKIFDPSRGGKAIATLIDAYQGRGTDAQGHPIAGKGMDAMNALLGGDASLKNASVGEMQKDASAAIGEQSVQLANSLETMRQKIAEKLGPLIDKIVDTMPRFIDAIGSLLDFVGKHPALAAMTAIAGTGALGMAKGFGGVAIPAAARWLAGGLVNTVPGAAGRMLGGAVGSVGNMVQSANSTPVFVTNWPAGMGGGGGDLPLPGAGAGAAGAGGATGGTSMLAGLMTSAPVVGSALGTGAGLMIGTIINHARKNGVDSLAHTVDPAAPYTLGDLKGAKSDTKLIQDAIGSEGGFSMVPSRSAKRDQLLGDAFPVSVGGRAGSNAQRLAEAEAMAAMGGHSPRAGRGDIGGGSWGAVRSSTTMVDGSGKGVIDPTTKKLEALVVALDKAKDSVDELGKRARSASQGVSLFKTEPRI